MLDIKYTYAKTRTTRGASFSIALLCMLVCTVIAAIVITAGTTAAGRVSELARIDQRYYSVTSAARLVHDELDKSSVVVTQQKTTTTTTVTNYTRQADGTVAGEVPAGGVSTKDHYTEITCNPSDDFATSITNCLLFGQAGVPQASPAWTEDPHEHASTSRKIEFTLTHDPHASIDTSKLKVKIEGLLNADGSLELLFSNDNGDSREYVFRMVLMPEVRTEQSDSESEAAPSVSATSEDSYTETTVKTLTQTRTTTVNWTVTDFSASRVEEGVTP